MNILLDSNPRFRIFNFLVVTVSVTDSPPVFLVTFLVMMREILGNAISRSSSRKPEKRMRYLGGKAVAFGSVMLLLLGTMNALAQGDIEESESGNPSTPVNLDFAIYSETAADIFWDRSTDNGFVVGYEIIRNGEILGIRDTLGVYEDELVPGVTYLYAVTAIDDDGNRSGTSTISLRTDEDQLPGGDNPAAPTGLQAKVYSATAAELFWNRPETFGLVYEIIRDGEVVNETDGVSYFDDTLSRGPTYQYEIVTIDLTGNRSRSAEISVNTSPDDTDEPSPPTNVTINIYSSTAAELFWERASAADNVVSTEVKRNGIVIGSAEGNSFFDDNRERGTPYWYALTAINRMGQRSNTTFLMESTVATINRDNHIEILEEVIGTYFGASYDAPLQALQTDILPDVLSEIFPGSDPIVFPFTYACLNGGTAFFDQSRFDVRFDNCQIDGALYDGQIEIELENRVAPRLIASNFSVITEPDSQINFDGIWQRSSNVYGATDVNFRSVSSSDEFVLENANTSFSFAHTLNSGASSPNFVAGFLGSFKVRSPRIDNLEISITTPSGFFYSVPLESHTDDWNYTEGVLQLTAEDGSQLMLDADTDDDTSVSIKLTNNGETEEFLQPWSLWHGVMLRSP